jgi:hypothetical protein
MLVIEKVEGRGRRIGIASGLWSYDGPSGHKGAVPNICD